jgi:hypothetical protein
MRVYAILGNHIMNLECKCSSYSLCTKIPYDCKKLSQSMIIIRSVREKRQPQKERTRETRQFSSSQEHLEKREDVLQKA